MYKNIIETMTTELNFQYENGIMKAVRDVGVIVDKEELVKALMYDRNQYDEGYRDGKKDALKWVPVSERLPKEDEDVLLMVRDEDGDVYYDVTYFHIVWQTEVGGMYAVPVAWMPLPEPYKGE